MATLDWEVWWTFPTGSGPVQIGDVQSVTIRMGRTQIQDPFKAGTATVTGRKPENLPIIEIGYPFQLKATDGSAGDWVYYGTVSDFTVEYGTVPAEDTWTISLEDSLAKAGRSFTSDSFAWSAGIRTDQAASQAATDCVIQLNNVWTGGSYVSQGQSLVSAQSLPNTNLLTILNQLAATEQGRICQDAGNIGWVNRSDLGQLTFGASFTDGTLTANYGAVPFTNVQFTSLADSAFLAVLVEPDGLAPQLSGAGGFRQFTLQSYDQTTTQAQNLADYVLATLNDYVPVPLTISTTDYVQTGTTLADLLVAVNKGCWAELILRGDRYELLVEGMTVTAVPGSTRCTFNVVSADAVNFFILDSTTFGVLDSSRLGF